MIVSDFNIMEAGYRLSLSFCPKIMYRNLDIHEKRVHVKQNGFGAFFEKGRFRLKITPKQSKKHIKIPF